MPRTLIPALGLSQPASCPPAVLEIIKMNASFRIALLLTVFVSGIAIADDRPNVIVMMSDDQGVGDYGFMGNPVIRTPHLDKMHAESGFLSKFYVSPVCAPTRASLVTGRYNYRTRCIDTYVGRAMMDTSEVTLAEFLRDAGYQTGIFGKWHMGDNYPLRAMDQGFQESLVHRGGGIGQPSDPIGAEAKYTDPTLIHNGKEVKMKGYCTDIYFYAAMNLINKAKADGQPFFTYIATNAPHGPYGDVPEQLYEEYKSTDLSPIMVGKLNPKRKEAELDKLARIAAMITNIDENVGRLLEQLDALEIADNTIVIYLNDNGPNTMRYVGDMRGMKSHVDDGGIRSPLLFRWPAKVKANASSDELCAHIDVTPTILEACGIDVPANHHFDGRSFLSLLTEDDASWPTRQVVFQTHRGNVPQEFNHFALHEDPWKLVHPSGFGNEKIAGSAKLELYNLKDDPTQQQDLAKTKPDVLNRLKADYQSWFKNVSSSRPDNYAPPRIIVGTSHEPETVLTRQDWRHSSGRPWGPASNGFWLLKSEEAADYEFEVILRPDGLDATSAVMNAGEVSTTVVFQAGQQRGHVGRISLPAGLIRLSVDVKNADGTIGPHQVVLSRVVAE